MTFSTDVSNPIRPWYKASHLVAEHVAAYLPDERVHVELHIVRSDGPLYMEEWRPRVLPCPRGGCTAPECYRAGEWMDRYMRWSPKVPDEI